MNNTYPKFQYSYFIGGNKDEQLVIRADTFEEFKQAKTDVDKIITKREESNKQTQAAPVQPDENICPTHNVAYQEKEGKFGKFWSHTIGKDAQGKFIYCNKK